MPPKPDPEPSDRQLEVLKYLISHIERLGFQPTHAEMANAFGVTKTAIQARLRELARRGIIEMVVGEKAKERAIRLRFVRFKAFFFQEPEKEE